MFVVKSSVEANAHSESQGQPSVSERGSLLQAGGRQWTIRAAYAVQVAESGVTRETYYSDVDSRWALVVSILYLVPDEPPPVD